MSTMDFVLLLAATVASSVSAVLHVIGIKNAKAEAAAAEIDKLDVLIPKVAKPPVAPKA